MIGDLSLSSLSSSFSSEFCKLADPLTKDKEKEERERLLLHETTP
jgi:hypothetical protein